MKKQQGNAPLVADAEIAYEFEEKAKALADVMTRAKRMGLECGFSGINPDQAGVLRVQNIMVKKIILPKS